MAPIEKGNSGRDLSTSKASPTFNPGSIDRLGTKKIEIIREIKKKPYEIEADAARAPIVVATLH